jgi:regulator of protease activity HflC (stomatin/prohibitin superfamily)
MLALKAGLILLGLVPLVIAAIKTFAALERGEKAGGGAIAGWVVVLLAAIVLSTSMGQVPAGYRGVVLQFKATTGEIKDEGFYFVFPPFIKTVQLMSVQVHAHHDNASAASKDLQFVTTDVTLNYALAPDKVDVVWKTLNKFIIDRVIKPSVQEGIKASTAQFTAEELITRRPEVRDAIQAEVARRLGESDIDVHALAITNFDFSETFAKAIESKVEAEQKALQAENDLIRIKTEAEQKIATAHAQAEALKLQKEAVTEDLVRLRIVEAQMAAIERWDGKLPDVITAGGPVPILDVFQPQASR